MTNSELEPFHLPDGFRTIQLKEGLEAVVYEDEILDETSGLVGRVHVSHTLAKLTHDLSNMSLEERIEFAKTVSDPVRGHILFGTNKREGTLQAGRSRLEAIAELDYFTIPEFARKVLAHHFDISEEALLVAGTADVFRAIPQTQATGLKKRLGDRYMDVNSGDIQPGDTVHLLSDGHLIKVVE